MIPTVGAPSSKKPRKVGSLTTVSIQNFVAKIRPGIVDDRVTRARTDTTGEPLVAMDPDSQGSLEKQVRVALEPSNITNILREYVGTQGGGGGIVGPPPSAEPPPSPETDAQVG